MYRLYWEPQHSPSLSIALCVVWDAIHTVLPVCDLVHIPSFYLPVSLYLCSVHLSLLSLSVSLSLTHIHIYSYIYMCVCPSVCLSSSSTQVRKTQETKHVPLLLFCPSFCVQLIADKSLLNSHPSFFYLSLALVLSSARSL